MLIQSLSRVFKMGVVRLPDIAPDMEPMDSLRLYAANYPHLASATLAPPVVEGEELIYAVEKPAVKTKG